MTFAQASPNTADWQQQANQYLLQANYTQAAYLYEQAIATEPEAKSYYWHLGLMLLLQGQEAEAQMAWVLGMAEGEPEQIEQWTAELIQILQVEAQRQEALEDYQLAWAIRQHIQEIAPTNVNNLLHGILLSIQLETFTGENLTASGIIELLEANESAVDSNLLVLVLQKILNYSPDHPDVFMFTEVCLNHSTAPQVFLDLVLFTSQKIAYSAMRPRLASRLAELCLRRFPNHIEVLKHITGFYQDSYQYIQGVETAKRYYELTNSLVDKATAHQLLFRALMSASGYWKEACLTLEKQKLLMLSLIQERPNNIEQESNINLLNLPFFLPYFNDDPHNNRFFKTKFPISFMKTLKFMQKM